MRCRPWLLGLLVVAPLLPIIVWFFGMGWVLYVREAAANFIDRQQAAAAARKRQAGYRAADGGLVADLASGRVGPGHPLDDLLVRFPAERVYRYRRFTRAAVRDGSDALVDLWAKDGRLIHAGRYPDRVRLQLPERDGYYDPFFEMSPADDMAKSAELTAVNFDRRDAAMAAAGPATYISFHERYTLP